MDKAELDEPRQSGRAVCPVCGYDFYQADYEHLCPACGWRGGGDELPGEDDDYAWVL